MPPSSKTGKHALPERALPYSPEIILPFPDPCLRRPIVLSDFTSQGLALIQVQTKANQRT